MRNNMEKVRTNTAYQIAIYSNNGRIYFTANRKYTGATWNGHTEFGFLGWDITTRKMANGVWKEVRYNDVPSRIGSKKGVIEFIKGIPAFSQAYNELTTKK